MGAWKNIMHEFFDSLFEVYSKNRANAKSMMRIKIVMFLAELEISAHAFKDDIPLFAEVCTPGKTSRDDLECYMMLLNEVVNKLIAEER